VTLNSHGIYTRQRGNSVCRPIGLESNEVAPKESNLTIDIHVDVDPYDKKADRPECLCQVECDEACLNRAMFYECDDQNCALDDPAECSNRAFQRAAVRYADHKARSCGFEVFNVLSFIYRVDSRLVIVGLVCVYYAISSRIH
jgi:hypothetical protein